MAERRMFHTAVVESDAFLDLPIGAQALYFHLGMQADEDGFVNGPKQIARMLRRPIKELNLLKEEGFVYEFDGIVVMKHWRLANSLQKDRIKPLRYPEIARKLYLNEARVYCLEGTETENLYEMKKALLDSVWIPSIAEHSKAKKSKAKKSINESNPAEQNRTEPLPGVMPTPVSSADTPSGEGGVPTPVSSADTPSLEGGVPTPVSSADTPSGEGVRGAVLDGGAVAAHVPASPDDRVCYDDSYVLLHRFGKGLVKLTANQIDGLRRIMEETELDGYVYQLAKRIESGDDPGEHYKTIKNWFSERNG